MHTQAKKEHQTAVSQLRTKNHQKAEDLYTKGLKAYMGGDVETAIREWQKALELEPGHSIRRRSLERGLRPR